MHWIDSNCPYCRKNTSGSLPWYDEYPCNAADCVKKHFAKHEPEASRGRIKEFIANTRVLTVDDSECFDVDADYFDCVRRGTPEWEETSANGTTCNRV